ncbi:MAG: hypothetical protein K0S45_2015 [Nitrospira sp.]|jgi:hypothetical protein|nr:hypothetical protein [Nitrospira sp.]
MIILSSSDPVHYRVTLFFGPDTVEHQPNQVRCVFNVKKRSWKGGVQVAVDVTRKQLVQARERIGHPAWLDKFLQDIEPDDQEDLINRAEDMLVQALCTCKLNLALHRGLEQANQIIAAEAFDAELDRAIDEQPSQLTDRIRLALDLGEVSDI